MTTMSCDYDWIDEYLANDCKDSSSKSPTNPPFELVPLPAGRWSVQEEVLYVIFSLSEICACSERNEIMASFRHNRRSYSSFDKRFVEFYIGRMKLEKPSPSEMEALTKRTKSKFNTLKRSFKSKSRARGKDARELSYLDFVDLMYESSKKLQLQIQKLSFGAELKQELEQHRLQFENYRRVNIVSSTNLQPEEVNPSRRYQVSNVKTRSSVSQQQKQDGQADNEIDN